MDYLQRIVASNVYDVAVNTPLDEAAGLSAAVGSRVLLKREDLQPIFSFKIRGAYNKLKSLSREQLARGVVAASAGNHAQGVALGSKKLGCRADIVMPVTTPRIKVDAVRRHGANVVLHGDSYSDAAAYAAKLCEDKGAVYIHPFDDPHVIAGQGSVGLEILNSLGSARESLHAIFVPIGGGGLVAGVAAIVKQLCPSVKVIGVQPEGSSAMLQSMRAGRRVELDKVDVFADGVAVKLVGAETFRLCREYVDDILLCSVDEMCAAIKDVFQDTRSILEPAGALSVAGMKKYAAERGLPRDGAVVAITTGANMNFTKLRIVSERADLGQRAEGLFGITIPEQPGSFRRLVHALPAQVNVSEFHYRHSDDRKARILVAFTVGKDDSLAMVQDRLSGEGFESEDFSGDDVAKEHLRFAVGNGSGRAGELLYRIEFPERAGALKQFLDAMNPAWDVSMFHYRHEGDIGRVFIGIVVPGNGGDGDRKAQVKSFLDRVGYSYESASESRSVRFFGVARL